MKYFADVHKQNCVLAFSSIPNFKFMQLINVAEQTTKFSIKDFFSKCDQIRSYWKNP